MYEFSIWYVLTLLFELLIQQEYWIAAIFMHIYWELEMFHTRSCRYFECLKTRILIILSMHVRLFSITSDLMRIQYLVFDLLLLFNLLELFRQVYWMFKAFIHYVEFMMHNSIFQVTRKKSLIASIESRLFRISK